MKMDIASMASLYQAGKARPSDVVASVYERIALENSQPVWISLVPRESALARARELERSGPANLPLYGIPFGMKDNFDLAGTPTTAGCPAFSYTPMQSAEVVSRLMRAGAMPIGKTNMDQFATGLVGTRSPYGACSSVFDSRYISGGSSSGSAVAVAQGVVSFSLGTDTAGSGRVPAAFNNLIGLKPTRGLLSAAGMVPACQSLDCVSVFSTNCYDAREVWRVAKGIDPGDPYSRAPKPGQGAAPWLLGDFRFGVPVADELEFFGDTQAAVLYRQAIRKLENLGGTKVEIDFSPFRAAADLLYSGPWVAERLAAIRSFCESHGPDMDPVVYKIISGAEKYSAIDAYEAQYRLRALRRDSLREWKRMDLMVLPTAPTIYTHEEIAKDPIRLNTQLGYYTNFVNLLDLAAVAAPAGFRDNDLPFGITFVGPAFTDEALLALADRYYHAETKQRESVRNHCCVPGCIAIAVVGAHLSGQPLNRQLTERGARLLKSTRTEKNYRLYALDGTSPAKPGLFRETGFEGPGIEVEVWMVPEDQFGSFVAQVPAPLGIGNVLLETGENVKGFICEPYALADAKEITEFGGWRAFLAGKTVM